MTDDPAKPPRFPFIAALFCSACLGAAGWTWMKYSYAWSVPCSCEPWIFTHQRKRYDATGYISRLRELGISLPNDWGRSMTASLDFDFRSAQGKYVQVSGRLKRLEDGYLAVTDDEGRGMYVCLPSHRPIESATVQPIEYGIVRLKGRPRFDVWVDGTVAALVVDTTASRFTGASIAGLVVGAMGVFVFTVALLHWLGEWRKFREEARA